MDFKTQTAPAAGLSGLVTDALLVLLHAADAAGTLDKPLADELARAVKDGDFQFKAGQSLYAHRVVGVKAARVLFVCAADASPKSLRKAVISGLGLLKSGGARALAVAPAGFALTAAHGEALVMAVTDSLYVYRETKPSAPAPTALRAVALVCDKAEADRKSVV